MAAFNELKWEIGKKKIHALLTNWVIRSSTGARLRKTPASVAIKLAWPTESKSSDSTRTPLDRSRLAIATVLRWVLTTLSLLGASSKAAGEALEA